MAAPPVPPRISSLYENPVRKDSAPPVPPLPPNFRPVELSNPHFDDPLVAPKPQKLMSSVPADMAQSLETQVAPQIGFAFPMAAPSQPQYMTPQQPAHNYFAPPPPPSSAPPPSNYLPGFGLPNANLTTAPWQSPPPQQHQQVWTDPRGPSPAPPPAAGWASPRPLPTGGQAPPDSAWAGSRPLPQSPPYGTPPHSTTPSLPSAHHRASTYTLPQSFSDLSLGLPSPYDTRPTPNPYDAPPSAHPTTQASPTQRPARLSPEPIPQEFLPPTPQASASQPPALTMPLPTAASLTSIGLSVSSAPDVARKMAWAKQVFALIERSQAASNSTSAVTDTDLLRLGESAIHHIGAVCNAPADPRSPPHVALAFYLRATLAATGSFPTLVPKDPRTAFQDFDKAARLGCNAAWFKLGRDYETLNDQARAKECFERGARLNEKSCLYRMGMAHLMGQLGLTRNPSTALPLLRQAADLADIDVPQPAYVFGMILLGEFSHIDIPTSLLSTFLPSPTPSNPDPRLTEARTRIERAAYLSFPSAQTKCGWAYEYAKMGCPFDPLLSVQYYSLASQQGETEADMALSKWFLCGAEGCFEKDESLACTFAEKAARRGLPSAEFAMGYYFEVGVGGKKDLNLSRQWYQKAADHGNPDAPARLQALSKPNPTTLSRVEHEAITENKLVRKRTEAKMFSKASGRGDGERKGTYDARLVAQQAMMSDMGAPPSSGYLSSPPPSSMQGMQQQQGSPSGSPRPQQVHPQPPRQDSRPVQPAVQPATAAQYRPPPRQNSGEGRGYSQGPGQGPGQGQGQGQGYPQGQPQGQGQGRPQAQGRGGGPSPRPPSAGGQGAPPHQQRPGHGGRGYSLQDGPSSGGPAPSAGGGPSGGRGGGPRPQQQQRPQHAGTAPPQNQNAGYAPAPSNAPPPSAPAPAPAPANAAPAKKPQGPATFAEMGIQGGRVEEKECIIM